MKDRAVSALEQEVRARRARLSLVDVKADGACGWRAALISSFLAAHGSLPSDKWVEANVLLAKKGVHEHMLSDLGLLQQRLGHEGMRDVSKQEAIAFAPRILELKWFSNDLEMLYISDFLKRPLTVFRATGFGQFIFSCTIGQLWHDPPVALFFDLNRMHY
jgi:hypothetical protein